MFTKITVEANKYKGGAWDCNPNYDGWEERAIYTTPERLISKYDLQLEGDKIRANKKVDEDEQIAISMLAEKIIEKLKTKEEK